MKKIITLFLFISVLCSCDKSSDPTEEPKAQYVLTDIKYFLNEGDGMRIDSFKIDHINYLNRSPIQQKLFITGSNYKQKLINTSQFFIDWLQPLDLSIEDLPLDGSIHINTPIDIKNSNIFLGQEKYIYNLNLETSPLHWSVSNAEYSIEPFQKLTVKIHIVRKLISTKYIATFTEKNSDRKVDINGEWEGKIIQDFFISTHTENLILEK